MSIKGIIKIQIEQIQVVILVVLTGAVNLSTGIG